MSLRLSLSTYCRKNVSHADAIFTTQEVINRYLQRESGVYNNIIMPLYDQQRAFDSGEVVSKISCDITRLCIS